MDDLTRLLAAALDAVDIERRHLVCALNANTLAREALEAALEGRPDAAIRD